MTDEFPENVVQNIPLINKHIVEKRPEEFGVDDPEILPRIFSRVNSHQNTKDSTMQIIEIASDILAGIIFEQPFKNGNKSTAFVLTQYYLQKKGFVIPLTISDNILVDLLESVSPLYLNEDQYTIAFSKVREFLSKNIIKIK